MHTTTRPAHARHATIAFPATRISALLQSSGAAIMRYGLALVILWFGLFKFTPSEALAIEPLVRNSPLLSWMYSFFGIRGVSAVIGIVEISIAVLMAVRARWPRASAIGSIGAIGMFATTLSFLVTTPGSWAWVDGMFVPAGAGNFLIKDLFLLSAALWTGGEALAASLAPKGARS